MQNYTSYFLGIPLPQQYKKEFDQVLTMFSQAFPELELVASQTPHVTIYYLNIQSKFALSEIKELIQRKANILADLSLTVGGYGYFSENNPMVVFLKVSFPNVLTEFNELIGKTLIKYSAIDNNLPFHPHITLGRIKSALNQAKIKETESNFKTKLTKINWNFQITELILYGVDSTKSPEQQDELLTIPLK